MNIILNILNQAFKKGRSVVMLKKIIRRFSKNKFDKNQYSNWLDSNKCSLEKFLKKIDHKLFIETKNESLKLNIYANTRLKNIKVKLGGGANDILLYFFVRYYKPKVILETGVAAGFSSLAILKALKKNKYGKLYSSDFPYFRIKNPENYIGILVDKKKFPNWELKIEGDEINIPKLISNINHIDIFHYDSDKTYEGKTNVYNLIKKKISDKSILIFDDIQDDIFFYEICQRTSFEYKIFKFNNKYIGFLGKIKSNEI